MDPQKTAAPVEQPSYFYFLVSGEIEFTERRSKLNKAPTPVQYWKTNTVFQSAEQGLSARSLGECQKNLQMAFYRKYGRTLEKPSMETVPTIRDVTILSTSFLGVFTEEQFLAKAQVEPAPQDQEAPSVPA
jgi:hypothetical protein